MEELNASAAIKANRAAIVALYLRNATKGSCDPKRAHAELEALAAAAGPFERLFAWHAAEERVLAAAPLTRRPAVASGDWTERMPAPGETSWFACLGLDKAAPV